MLGQGWIRHTKVPDATVDQAAITEVSMDRCNKKIQRSGIWCRSQDKEANMTRRKGKTSGKCQIFPQFLQYIVYVQEEKITKKRSQLFSSSAQRKNLISRANPNTQAISNSKAKGGKKRNSWRIKAKGIINCFAIPPLDFQLPPYLHIHRSKRKVKKKRTQFSSKRTPNTTQCRPTRPLVPRAQARPLNMSPASTVGSRRKGHPAHQPWLANPREWPGVPNFIKGAVAALKAIKQKNVSLSSHFRVYLSGWRRARCEVVKG